MTPLERAARALALQYMCESQAWEPTDEVAVRYANSSWIDHVDQVRAVLAAIRGPNRAMIEAGGEQVLDTEVGAGQYASIADGRGSKLMANNQAVNAWAAMIDAILAGSE